MERRKVLLTLVLILMVLHVIPVPGTGEEVEKIAPEEGKFIEVCGLKVYYVERQGKGENVLLLHGFGASTYSWRYVLSSNISGRIIAFDRPGFGFTERKEPDKLPCNPYSPEGAAELTIELMDGLGMDKAVLVGHSAGAGVALLVALRAPERVEKLVLVAPAWSPREPSTLQRLLYSLPLTEKFFPLFIRSSVGRLEEVLENAWYNQSRLTDEVREGYKAPLRARDWDKGLFWVMKYSSFPDITGELKNLEVPTVVIHCKEDRIVPVESGEMLARVLPNAELVLMEGCGHLPHEENPEEFLKVLEKEI